jgi:hypothetical protein
VGGLEEIMIALRPLILVSLLATAFTAIAEEEKEIKTPPPIEKNAKHPREAQRKLMSDDPTYGYSQKNPIKVGSEDEFGGPAAEREYLESLLGPDGTPIKFVRQGSGGKSPDGNIMDIYQITIADGSEYILWIDMYHPKSKPARQPAPVGLYKKKD